MILSLYDISLANPIQILEWQHREASRVTDEYNKPEWIVCNSTTRCASNDKRNTRYSRMKRITRGTFSRRRFTIFETIVGKKGVRSYRRGIDNFSSVSTQENGNFREKFSELKSRFRREASSRRWPNWKLKERKQNVGQRSRKKMK